MTILDLEQQFSDYPQLPKAIDILKREKELYFEGVSGSLRAVLMVQLFRQNTVNQFLVANDADTAAYLYNDLSKLLSEEDVSFFPSSYKKTLVSSELDTTNEILRTETLTRLSKSPNPILIVSYPEALLQHVPSSDGMQSQIYTLSKGENIDMNFLIEMLLESNFERVEFVYEPGQFSVRGGIVDIFSFANEYPYRVDFFGDEIDSIRVFDIESQLSLHQKDSVQIVPNMRDRTNSRYVPFSQFVGEKTVLHFSDFDFVVETMNRFYQKQHAKIAEDKLSKWEERHMTGDIFKREIKNNRKVYWCKASQKKENVLQFSSVPQPTFLKNFELIAENLSSLQSEGYLLCIVSDSTKQTDRIASIFADRGDEIFFKPIKGVLHEGFIDHQLKIVCYTDHQIFDRFHKYRLKTDQSRKAKALTTIKELNQFNVGDYVVHTDHGIGKFGGLVRSAVNGKMQEMVKLIYRDNDVIFVSIHALHRISKYKGKEGETPRVHKLGSGAWERLKNRTKSKVKDIARELIKLYAKRKQESGFRYSEDSYLQHELEASFPYEDTPDQEKSTKAIKRDMESDTPMDRLVCGDVGYGKTELAIRAAFKAVTDNKQVAVLVPTTVLATQHFKTFTKRLKEFPCRVEYLTRVKTAKETRLLSQELSEGKIDILIGTHKLVGKTIAFKDLGLLIIDEEQKFGVSVKEKLKQLKVNVDTLTLTATPIPRTLQFSLLGARDLSIINTPPPNRFPVQTELHTFDREIIAEAIQQEMARNGQVFFINNRVQNIHTIEALIKNLVPECRVVVGHGQMPPKVLEEILIDFINYEYDVLIATTIVESGIDIPNVNTIIINNAHRFGLSDLHQLRGRVGRSNRKSYCYLLAPDKSLLSSDARRRLYAIETFSDLGSGFNIAMQDLDIRGAGNMLGAEQSGFIADLGYETYQRILTEAVQELKNEEFAELYAAEQQADGEVKYYVTDCLVDTDLEITFSEDYVENISERMRLYRELDSLKSEEELTAFVERMEDRFGKLPTKAQSLTQVIRLRWLGVALGMERIVLKNGRMICYFVSDMKSPYFYSPAFNKVLRYFTLHSRKGVYSEDNNRPSVKLPNIRTVEEALRIMQDINDEK